MKCNDIRVFKKVKLTYERIFSQQVIGFVLIRYVIDNILEKEQIKAGETILWYWIMYMPLIFIVYYASTSLIVSITKRREIKYDVHMAVYLGILQGLFIILTYKINIDHYIDITLPCWVLIWLVLSVEYIWKKYGKRVNRA